MLWDVYLVCTGVGFVYLVGTAALGFMNQQGDSGGDSGDAGSADAGEMGGADAGEMGGADAGDVGSVDAGDVGSADGGDFGSADGGDFGSAEIRQVAHAGRHNLANVRTGVIKRKRLDIGLLILKLISPYTITCFGFFFGLAGLITLKYLPFLGPLTLLPATISGVIGYNIMTALMNSLADSLYASSNYHEETIIGHKAEISIPIEPGRVGEIIYLAGKVRSTASARGADPTKSFAKGSKVMIANRQEDGVFLVESWTEHVLDDPDEIIDNNNSITIHPQQLRNS